jgi:hypothetical protein
MGRGGFSSHHVAVICEALGLDISMPHIHSAVAQGRNHPDIPYSELTDDEWHFMAKVAYGQPVKVKEMPNRLEDEHRESFKRWSAKSSPAVEHLLKKEEETRKRPPVIPAGEEALARARSETPGTKEPSPNGKRKRTRTRKTKEKLDA